MIYIKVEKEQNLIKFKGMKKHTLNSILIHCAILAIYLLIFLFSIKPSYALLDPSAVYCTALGYSYTTETTSKGEKGLCLLPNSQLVDAWQFLQGKVAQEYNYCSKEGYETKTVIGSEKCLIFLSNDCAVCILGDGTEIEVTQLMNLSFEETTCGDGTCGIPENFSTCPKDCPSGGSDGYCDGIPDGQCDSDCLNGEDPDSVDSDSDGIANCNDNCQTIANPDQHDIDGNGIGDACDFKKICSYLGNNPKPSLPDVDIFKFSGKKGETVAIRVEANPPEASLKKRVILIMTAKTRGIVLFKLDNSLLPNEIKAKLPATGEYLITVAEQPLIAKGQRYRGNYCLSLKARPETYQTLAPYLWVE